MTFQTPLFQYYRNYGTNAEFASEEDGDIYKIDKDRNETLIDYWNENTGRFSKVEQRGDIIINDSEIQWKILLLYFK